jgi:hypothetical protein
MTVAARNGTVCTRQREQGFTMIERCRTPSIHRMTGQTIMIKIVCDMIRICNRIKISLMTGKTIGRKSGVLSVLMAIKTGDGGMCAD